MVLHNALLCFALSATSLSRVSASSSSKADDIHEDSKTALKSIKEAEGVLKSGILDMEAPRLKKDPALSAVGEAVLDAEKRQVDNPEDAKEAKEEEEALAAAEAATKVMEIQWKKTFGQKAGKVNWEKVQEEARQAYLAKKEQGGSNEEATSAAFQVEIGEIQKKLQKLQEADMPEGMKDIAKNAAEAAGDAIADTDNPVDALGEAISKMSIDEDEEKAHERHNKMAYILLFILCAGLIYVTAKGYLFDRDSPYVQRLREIRKEEDRDHQPIEFDSMYNMGGYSEMR